MIFDTFNQFLKTKKKPDWSFKDQKKHFIDFNHSKYKINKVLASAQTPIFITSKKIVADRYKAMNVSLNKFWGEDNHIIAYSYKTNYQVANSKILKKMGAWAEVVSENEYKLAKKHGYQNKIIYNGPYKTKKSLVRAAQDGAIIHLDNFSDLDLAISLSHKLRQKAQWGIRLNFKTAYFPQGNRFGFNVSSGQAKKAIAKMKTAKIPIKSLHLHQGSDISTPDLYTEISIKTVDFINHLKLNEIAYIDIGGGFPSHGIKPVGYEDWKIEPIETYISAIVSPLKKLSLTTKPKLILEPGRYLVDDATIFITQVLDVQNEIKQQQILADGAITMMPLVHYRPQIIKAYTPNLYPKKSKKIPSIVYGSTCKNDDRLFTGLLPKINTNDLLVFYCVGAYNDSLGTNFIFNKPKSFFI